MQLHLHRVRCHQSSTTSALELCHWPISRGQSFTFLEGGWTRIQPWALRASSDVIWFGQCHSCAPVIHHLWGAMLHRYVMVYIADIFMYTWVITVVQLWFECYQRSYFCFFVLKFATHVPYLHNLMIFDSYLHKNVSLSPIFLLGPINYLKLHSCWYPKNHVLTSWWTLFLTYHSPQELQLYWKGLISFLKYVV